MTSTDLEKVIRQWLDKQVVTWESDQTPLMERLPTTLVAVVEQQIAGYLPLAIDRIAGALSDPTARTNIQDSMHRLFEGFVKNLLLHERIVARLVVTERTFARLLDNVERDGVEQVTKLLRRTRDAKSGGTQCKRCRGQVPPKTLGRTPRDTRPGTCVRYQGYNHRKHRGGAAGSIHTGRSRLAASTRPSKRERNCARLGNCCVTYPADEATAWAASAVATPRARGWIVEGTTSALGSLLDRPIGRPSDRLPEGSIGRITTALSPAIWRWIEQQVPRVVEQLDIQSMVEEKVLGFSLERIEQIVRNTTQRELDLIIKLGYALGAVVGAVAYGVSIVLP